MKKWIKICWDDRQIEKGIEVDYMLRNHENPKVWDEARWDQIYDFLKQGKTLDDIAKFFGITKARLSERIRWERHRLIVKAFYDFKRAKILNAKRSDFSIFSRDFDENLEITNWIRENIYE